MIYPPEGSPTFGRAQLPGSRVLYASWNVPTALDEIGAQVGDLIQIIALRAIEGIDLPCHAVGEWHHYYNTGRTSFGSERLDEGLGAMHARMSPEEFLAQVLVDAALAEFFRASVQRTFEYKYKRSAVYADMMHRTGQLGLMYPSVKLWGAMNLALPAEIFDSQFEVLFTEALTIKRSYGRGLYGTSLPDYSCEFGHDGEIDWNSSRRLQFTRTQQEGLRAAEPMHGWRKGWRGNGFVAWPYAASIPRPRRRRS